MENPKRRMKTESAASARGVSGESDPRHRFIEEAASYAKANGMPVEQAKKELFRGLIDAFNTDLSEQRRFVSADSDLFEMQEAALAETAPLTAKDAGLESAAFRKIVLPPHTREELESAKQYLAERFEGARIIEPLAADYLDLTRELEEIVARLSADDRLKESESLPALFARARDVKADVARMLEIKHRLALHERHLLGQVRAKEAAEKYQEAQRSFFNDAFANPLSDFFKVWSRHAKNGGSFGSAAQMVLSFLPLFAKFTFHSGKLLHRAAQTLARPHALSLK